MVAEKKRGWNTFKKLDKLQWVYTLYNIMLYYIRKQLCMEFIQYKMLFKL